MDQNTKPVDRWLGLGGVVVGVILYLLPEKTPITVVLCSSLIFVLLVHPTWNFWWIEDAIWRRLAALGTLITLLVCLSLFVWPVPPGTGSLFHVTTSTILKFRLKDEWLQRTLGAVTAALIFVTIILVRKAYLSITRRRMVSHLPKGFLDYKAEAEAAITALPKVTTKLSQIMQRVGPALGKQKNKLQRAKTTEQQIGVAKATARRLDGFSRQFERVCDTYQATGDSLAEGLSGWFAWVSKSRVNKTELAPFADSLRILVDTMQGTNSQTQAYIDSMNAGKGVTSMLDAGIDRHVQSVETILNINQTIRASCMKTLALLEALPAS